MKILRGLLKMKRTKTNNELFYSYILNIKNNPTKISNKNRGINYGRKGFARQIRNKKDGQKYI